MQESVIYQSIVQKEALRLIDRLLNRRFGDIAPEIEQRIRSLSTADLENLGEALLDFSNTNDLVHEGRSTEADGRRRKSF
jgi:phage FluMu protein gp41